MSRPSFQFYPDKWRLSSKLALSSHAEKGMWIDILCLLHDSDEYGIIRSHLKSLSHAISAKTSDVQKLVDRGVLKGADFGHVFGGFTYTPRHGRRDGIPVILIPQQPGPIWFFSRMVIDEYKRVTRESHLPTERQFK